MRIFARAFLFAVGAFLVKNGVEYALAFCACGGEQGFVEACLGAPLLVLAFRRSAPVAEGARFQVGTSARERRN